jgi:hypothetical protein
MHPGEHYTCGGGASQLIRQCNFRKIKAGIRLLYSDLT